MDGDDVNDNCKCCKWCCKQTFNVKSCYCCSMAFTGFICLIYFWLWMRYENRN